MISVEFEERIFELNPACLRRREDSIQNGGMKVGFSGKDGDEAVLLRRNLSISRPAALEMSPWALKSPLELKSPARMIP